MKRWVPVGIVLAGLSLMAVVLFAACSGTSGNVQAPTSEPSAASVPTSTPLPLPPTPTPAPDDSFPGPITASCDVGALEVRRGNSTRQQVALTFDAGSDRGYTSQILQTLADNGIKASFSLTGVWAEENPDLTSAIAAGGHLIMNHSYDHPSFTGNSTGEGPLSTQERLDELDRADSVIMSITGQTTKPYFRPPYGDYDGSVLCDAYTGGYKYLVMWAVDTLGWNGASVDEIVQKSLSNAKPGTIYIMHVGSQSQDALALQRVIDGLKAQGYSFGTIADILG